MINESQFPKLENTRGKFVRMEDRAVFYGWVVGERDPQFLVTLEDPREVFPGDTFLCELHLHGWTLKCVAVISTVSTKCDEEGHQTVSIVGMTQVKTVNVQHGQGNERFRVQGIAASVSTTQARFTSTCDVLDVSRDGLAVLLPETISPGSQVYAMIQCEGEALQFECEVRYSRAAARGFRTGLRILHQDRLARQKWRRFIAEINGQIGLIAA